MYKIFLILIGKRWKKMTILAFLAMELRPLHGKLRQKRAKRHKIMSQLFAYQ